MNPSTLYQDASVSTQNKGRLIVILYDGAIKFLRLAIPEMHAKNFEAKGRYINKAIAIITELNTILDTDTGGEVAANLRKLYLFMHRHLTQANIKCDPKMVQEVINLLEELNKGWKTVAK